MDYRLLPRGDLPPFITQFQGALDRSDGRRPLPVKAHAENLSLFLPRITNRRWQVEWGTVAYRSVAALLFLEYVCRGDPDFGDRSKSFGLVFKSRLEDKDWVRKFLFGTRKSGKVWMSVLAQGEKRPRKVKVPRMMPGALAFANGYWGTTDERNKINDVWRGAGECSRVLGMGPLNDRWRWGAPGQHWLGAYPDIWERVPVPLPRGNRHVKKGFNFGRPGHLVKKKRSQRNRKWFGFYLPRTEWQLPEWAGFNEVKELELRTVEAKGRRPLDKGDRDVFLWDLGFAREVDWQRWVLNGWHNFEGALEAVRGCADERVRSRLGTHPFMDLYGGPGSPLRDPRGKPGERGNWIDWVETEAPWVYVRFTREFKRDLVTRFNNTKEEWNNMEDPIKGLSKPIQKIIEPFVDEARNMTEREKHTHIMTLGDGVGAFCKHVGELRMTGEEGYVLAFPDKSHNPNTVRGCSSRLMKDNRVALGIAIFALARQVVVKTAAEVKFSELHSRIMEVYQAAMDTANHKEALNAIKLLADISGHSGKGKTSAASGVNVNILNQSNGSTSANNVTPPSGGFGNLALIENQPSVLMPESREQRAKSRLKQLINVMDTREKEMEWVNTTNLELEDTGEEEDDVE